MAMTIDSRFAAALLLIACAGFASPDSAVLDFRSTFSDEPLDVSPAEGETVTEAVRQFHKTAKNAYRGEAEAIERGGAIFLERCAICHGIKANGRMGPSLIDDAYLYPKNNSDKGVFETIYGGAAAAMVPLRGTLSQDDILKIMAYVTSLRK